MPEIYISNMQQKIEIDESLESLVAEIIKVALKKENTGENVEVSVVLVDNDYIQKLNKQYRSIDAPTDVLSFAMNESICEQDYIENEGQEQILGDIIISVERAKEQAAEFGHSFEREVGYLAVHGFLHLLGFDHESQEDKEIMRAKEEEILKEFDLSRRTD